MYASNAGVGFSSKLEPGSRPIASIRSRASAAVARASGPDDSIRNCALSCSSWVCFATSSPVCSNGLSAPACHRRGRHRVPVPLLHPLAVVLGIAHQVLHPTQQPHPGPADLRPRWALVCQADPEGFDRLTQGVDGMQRSLDGYPQWVRYLLAVVVMMSLSVAFSLTDGTPWARALSTAGVLVVFLGIFLALYHGWRPWRRQPKDRS